MRRFRVVLITVMLLLTVAPLAYGMTPPILYYGATPALLPFMPDNAPISLTEQTLTADCSGEISSLNISMVLKNTSEQPQSVGIVLPYLTTPVKAEELLKQVKIDNAQPTFTLRFTPMPIDDEPGTLYTPSGYSGDHFSRLRSASWSKQIAALGSDEPYKLKAFDENVPLSGYDLTITGLGENSRNNVKLFYDESKTKLFLDPGTNYLREAGEDNPPALFGNSLNTGEACTFRIFVLGEDTFGYEADDSCSSRLLPISGISLGQAIGEYVHKFDYEHPELTKYADQIALMEIDTGYANGETIQDYSRLYGGMISSLAVGGVVKLDFAPGESHTLTSLQPLRSGMDAITNEKISETFFALLTESLSGWSSVGKTSLKVVAGSGLRDIRSTLDLTKKSGAVYTAEFSGIPAENIYVGMYHKYKAPFNTELTLIILWALFIRFLPVIVPIVCVIIFWAILRRKRKAD